MEKKNCPQVKPLFPDYRLGVSKDLELYRYEKTENGYLLCLQRPTFENDLGEMYRYKEGGTVKVFVFRKATKELPRQLVYDNYKDEQARYVLLMDDLALILPRSGDAVFVNSVQVLPLCHPEKVFSFIAGCGNWMSMEEVGYEAGVLRLGRRYYVFNKAAEGKYKVTEISREEAASKMGNNKPTSSTAGWIPGELVDEL